MTKEELLEIRKSLHLSQEQLSNVLGVTVMTVHRLENGISPISKDNASLINNIRTIYYAIGVSDSEVFWSWLHTGLDHFGQLRPIDCIRAGLYAVKLLIEYVEKQKGLS